MSFLVIVIVALFGLALGQTTYECQCGLFAPEQFAGQILDAAPIPFRAEVLQANPSVCNEPAAGNNTCKYLCDQYARENWNDFEFCDAEANNVNETGIARCYGGLYCESLYRDGRLPDEDLLETSVRVYYRMPECPDESRQTVWTLATYEHPEALCCSAVGTYSSCYDGEDCECVKVDQARYCECGVFAQVQHQVGQDDALIPAKMVSSQQGDAPFSYCDNFAGGAFDEPCNQACRDFGIGYFGNYSLLDDCSNDYGGCGPGTSYGEFYCNTLRSRRIFFNQYINTALISYKRSPFCIPDNLWLTADPLVSHPERLCCNEAGEFEYPCPTFGRANPAK